MARAQSLDLRERVVEEVAKERSCRQTAARFGVCASSAIRWAAKLRSCGALAPKEQGGDRRSQRIEAEAVFWARWQSNPIGRSPNLRESSKSAA